MIYFQQQFGRSYKRIWHNKTIIILEGQEILRQTSLPIMAPRHIASIICLDRICAGFSPILRIR